MNFKQDKNKNQHSDQCTCERCMFKTHKKIKQKPKHNSGCTCERCMMEHKTKLINALIKSKNK